tara:strand:+ start:782 stop:1057 length:276 start_codon:yes stop_codon:yes gene_type:complete
MLLSLNPHIKNTIALWPNEAIVYHPYRGYTNHLDSIAAQMITLLSEDNLHINELTDFLYQNKKNTFSLEYTEQLVHSYISELLECEIVIKC